MYIVFLLCALISVLAIVFICVFLFAQGLPTIFRDIGFFKFIFNGEWYPVLTEPSFGIAKMIIGSLFVTAFTLVLAVPVGFFISVYLATSASARIVKTVRPIIELLAGVPSVIYGFVGLILIKPIFNYGVFSAGIVLSMMILPTIITLSITAIKAVPEHYYEGAVALGASHSEAVYKVVVPAAKRGIISSVVLAAGRAIGETTAVMLVAGNSPNFIPKTLFQPVRTLTANIVMEMGYAQGLHADSLIATGVVLFVFILILNSLMGLLKPGGSKGRQTAKAMAKGSLPVVAAVAAGAELSVPVAGAGGVSQSGLTPESASGADTVVYSVQLTERRQKVNVLKRAVFGHATLNLSRILTGVLIFLSLGLVAFVFFKGMPHISWNFLTAEYTPERPTIMPFILATFYALGLGLLISVPVGVFAGVFITEYSSKKNPVIKLIIKFIRSATETLAGLPSIIFGLFGGLMFVEFLGLGYSILAGTLTLVLIILPTIIRSSEEAILSVPDTYREASMALGASKLRTIFKVVLPSAASGILAGIILSVGRIFGESAALLPTMGTGSNMPSLMRPGQTLAVALFWFTNEGTHFNEAYATATVLIIFVLLINVLSGAVRGKVAVGNKTA